MKIYKLVFRAFAKNVIAIPPKLKHKNPPKESKYKNSPIYNLLKSEKLAEANNEKINLEEKNDYDTIIAEAAKIMKRNYFMTYSDKDQMHKDIKNLQEFMSIFNPKEMNIFIKELAKAKTLLDEDIEKTEEIFRLFLCKLYNISQNKIMNRTLINMISKISLKDISPNDLFKSSGGNITLKSKENESQLNIQKSIHFSQVESNMSSVLNIRNPITSDFEHPEEDFKDAFLMKHENAFGFPLITQKDSNQTRFEFSNYIIFHNMPFYYPIYDKVDKQVVIKQLTNEIIYNNKINLKISPEYKNFVVKYITKALESTDERLKPKIEITDLHSTKSEYKDYYDFELLQESMDFIQEVFETTPESKDPSMDRVSRYHSVSDNKQIEIPKLEYNTLINNTKFFQHKKQEIDKFLRLKLKAPIYCNGLLHFNSYEEKKTFLKSGAGIFGMHLQGKLVKFYDADFCNLVVVKQVIDDSVKVDYVTKVINSMLKLKNFNSSLLEIPQYIVPNNKFEDIADEKIYLRFNCFSDTLKAYNIIRQYMRKQLFVKLPTPTIRYYNGNFVSGYELVFKNTITNLEKILSINSNYIEYNNILDKEII